MSEDIASLRKQVLDLLEKNATLRNQVAQATSAERARCAAWADKFAGEDIAGFPVYANGWHDSARQLAIKIRSGE